ncbi:MAG TPA: OmpA family protein [Flavobacteriaceae bacterium]|nr:OmpA family protein [Flavobacteriaceae bacterium]
MKNKYSFYFFIGTILLSIATVQGQDYRLNLANRFFENTFYSDAIPLYEELADKSPQTMLNLADSYCYTFQLENARKWYEKMARNYPQFMNEEYAFRYVQVLKALGKTDKVAEISYKFLVENPEDKQKLRKDSAYLERVKSIGDRYEMENLPFNSPFSEFGGTVFNNQLIFAASRKETGLFSKMFRWDNLPYLDLYCLPKNSNKNEIPTLFSEELTTQFHESSATFSSDGKTVYFTRNNYMEGKIKLDSKQVNNLKIYKAEWKNGKWSNIKSLPFNSDDYSTEHPALSPDGKILYFSSNMPGGQGSFDLYKVSTETYQNPMNLGPEINTKYKEQFPFLDAQGNLYFASDGHPTFGFLDIFMAKKAKTNFDKPENVGLPVNSGYDDFAFSIDPETKNGFVSSNRPGGKGNDDIYKIHETKPLDVPRCFQIIKGVVVDKKTQQSLENSWVKIQNETKVLDSILVSKNGTFNFKVECGATYLLQASKKNYQSDSLKISTDFISEKDNETKLKLSKIQSEATLRKEKLLNLENEIVQKKDRLLIQTAPIHFDYDLWNIRKEAKPILNKVVAILKKYPTIEVEIGAHTDVRGTKSYNEELSGKRAASVMQYLIESGIDASRLTSQGYGESKPIIECVPENSCTEKQHETNRRCEFVITSW